MIGKRKFFSEFSVGITSNGWLMFTPDQLHTEGKMNDAHQDILIFPSKSGHSPKRGSGFQIVPG
ncbi:hypothetical protein [Morganella morganii]|uniref:hypothetical protein n=1 Tax=Morganella morganii TaxID=582 RepID=UPI001C48885A|nr:hypothetical protein [Morganella morganii]QXO54656.1 hypothetical protein JC830_03910 [Morganella morganii]